MVAVAALIHSGGGWWRDGDDLVEEERGTHARIADGAAVGRVVAAIDTAAGQVDADIALFQVSDPVAGSHSVPLGDVPGGGLRVAAEDGYGVALREEVASEDAADLSAAAGNHNSHGRYLCRWSDSATWRITAFRSRSRLRM